MASADIELKRNDTRPYLDSVLTDANGAVDVTGATIKFYMIDESDDSEVVNQTTTDVPALVSIENSTAGSVRYKWQAADTSTGGNFLAEWQVTFADATKATFPNDEYLTVYIRDDLDST